MRRYWECRQLGQHSLTGEAWLGWLAGLSLAVLVKVLGVQVGGWLTLVGLGILSGWLPWLTGRLSHQVRSKRQLGYLWTLQLMFALIWLPLGWGGYLATLQASVSLPAAFQNWLFMTRYQWLPIVGSLWAVLWVVSWKWLPSFGQQLRQLTTWRAWWLTGWHTPFWPVVWRLCRLLGGVLGWLVLVGMGIGVVAMVERVSRLAGLGMAVLVVTGVQWDMWCWFAGGLQRWLKCPVSTRPHAWRHGGYLILSLGLAIWWLNGTNLAAPAVIAHRGVNGHNGVQNTTTALKRTVKATQPAAVEMDIQPTADHQWVVMHDPTLDHLADRRGPVSDYQLNQLAGLPLLENGQHGRLSTFSHYLKTAHHLQQPLLVEIKALGPADELMPAFADKYGRRLSQHQDQVHSLDYAVVARLKRQAPQLRVGFITPFYLTDFQKNAADFYSLQALTVTREQLAAAKRQGKPVYLWTVDRPLAMQRLTTLGATGLITNRPGKLRHLMQGPRLVYTYQLINWVVSWL
ncbi:glycerophosphodiester phosphodiesterase [Lactiplantibacillus daowaiensis]|uniref:Glycerophosphodiester phosphodiesterase family protein n=1 Tax=Lactiplantibacillus daowaiensis TaxID=2559918 RepID=A0ABW1S137_9LACO|nr:glycerophosphodiester phosphodiesterase [Lactiplantibacillus daowaiensis]